MELNYDWRGFQSVFTPRPKLLPAPTAQPTGPIYVVHDGMTVLCAAARGETTCDWIGMPFAEFKSEFSHREVIAFERDKVDEWTLESLSLPHFFDQSGFLLDKADPQKKTLRPGPLSPSQHFLLESLHGWWGKVLPSAYGIFLRLESEGSWQDFLVLVRRGRIEGFCEPDLASMGPERSRQPADVVKYLSEKYLVPVQGLFVPEADWASFATHPHPWRQVAMALRANRAKLVPFRWGLVVLMASRAFLEI
jgi:hypothetical protein